LFLRKQSLAPFLDNAINHRIGEHMQERTLKLELPILFSGIEDENDSCLALLLPALRNQKGIKKAHIDKKGGTAQICLHFDPNIISSGAVQKIASRLGADMSVRYRHMRIPFFGMHTADSGISLKHVLENIPGVMHVRVNYAAGLIFIAYDTTILDIVKINQVIRKLGYSLIKKGAREEALAKERDHGGAPAFLPRLVKERWVIIMVMIAGLSLFMGWAGESFFGISSHLALLFFLISYFAGGYDIATHAIPGVLNGQFDTDVLMLTAAVGAALLGEWAEGAFLLFLFSLGHAGEHYALDRARNAINELGSLMPKIAKVKRGSQIKEGDTALLSIGDVVIVSPGDRIPVDGTILKGESYVDQSAITGESAPINKRKNDLVYAGTVNQEASLEIKVSKKAKDNTLSRIMELVAEAQNQQSPTQQFTQHFTKWFVPAILILVLVVVAIPPMIGWMPLNQSFYRGMLLLVAASPCALAIGTPASILAGIAQAARNGVLIKGGMHLENLGSINVMVFDKTGTLTEGCFKISDIIPFNGSSREDVLRAAAAVEQLSNHPIANSIVHYAREKGINIPLANGLENLAGRGVRSKVDGQEVLIGSLKLFDQIANQAVSPEIITAVTEMESVGKTTIVVSKNMEILGLLALADVPRPNLLQTLTELRNAGIKKIIMLTGDNEAAAKHIANELGLNVVFANLMPEEKLKVVNQLKKEYSSVAMIGDGVNDAPALAAATVGIAMGGAGTAVALETADVALMADDLSKLPFAVGLSRASSLVIRQNLWISLGVIGYLVVSSVLGWMPLSWTVIFHEGSSILVVLNALRLLGYKKWN